MGGRGSRRVTFGSAGASPSHIRSRPNPDLWTLVPYVFCIYNRHMENKRGRPRKAQGQTKAETLIVHLAAEEKAAFSAAADFAEQDLSVWVRERLRHSARKELQGLGQSVPFLEQALGRTRRISASANGTGVNGR